MKVYELIPKNGRKSFYGKAQVMLDEATGDETLISYGTPIVRMSQTGMLTRLYDGDLSPTTGTHLKSFCGMTAKDFRKLVPKH